MHDVNGFILVVAVFMWRKEIISLFRNTIKDILNSQEITYYERKQNRLYQENDGYAKANQGRKARTTVRD